MKRLSILPVFAICLSISGSATAENAASPSAEPPVTVKRQEQPFDNAKAESYYQIIDNYITTCQDLTILQKKIKDLESADQYAEEFIQQVLKFVQLDRSVKNLPQAANAEVQQAAQNYLNGKMLAISMLVRLYESEMQRIGKNNVYGSQKLNSLILANSDAISSGRVTATNVNDPHYIATMKLIDEMVAQKEELVKTLTAIDSNASAKAACPEVRKLVEQISSFNQQLFKELGTQQRGAKEAVEISIKKIIAKDEAQANVLRHLSTKNFYDCAELVQALGGTIQQAAAPEKQIGRAHV